LLTNSWFQLTQFSQSIGHRSHVASPHSEHCVPRRQFTTPNRCRKLARDAIEIMLVSHRYAQLPSTVGHVGGTKITGAARPLAGAEDLGNVNTIRTA
jgi:hypothetical protein